LFLTPCCSPAGYTTDAGDCDDGDPECHTGCRTYYEDKDEDGFGNPNRFVVQCPGRDIPLMHIPMDGDCDDSTSTGTRCYRECHWYYYDKDDDGYGVASDERRIQRCEPEDDKPYAGMSRYFGDCDETSLNAKDRNDGHREICDGIDNDCNPDTPDGADVCGAIEDDQPGGCDWSATQASGFLVCYGTCDDEDKDGVCKPYDNCPNHSNPEQADMDEDGLGDACDDDADGDGHDDATDDNCPTVYNPGQVDSDSDQIGDACDFCDFVVDDATTNVDADGDGYDTLCDNCVDIFNDQADYDGDGVGDACDPCWQDKYNVLPPCDGDDHDFWVEYRPGNGWTNPDGWLRIDLMVFHEGTLNVPLDELTIRYWYALAPHEAINQPPQKVNVWWEGRLPPGCMTTQIVDVLSGGSTTKQYYVEVGFSCSAELTIRDDTGDLQFAISDQVPQALSDATKEYFDYTNDYSFLNTPGYIENTKIGLYRNGELVFGNEPSWM
jgi:hypothetical protein